MMPHVFHIRCSSGNKVLDEVVSLGHVKRNITLTLLHLTFPSVNPSALLAGTCTRLGEGS